MKGKLWTMGAVWALAAIAACGSRTGILGDVPSPVEPGPRDAGEDRTVPLEAGDAHAAEADAEASFDADASDAEASFDADASFDVSIPDALFAPDANLLCDDGGLPHAYLLDADVTIYLFDPMTGLATLLGTPSCGGEASGWTLSVSRAGIGYIVFEDTWDIWAVDLKTLACKQTVFSPSQLGGQSDYGLAVSRAAGSDALFLYGEPFNQPDKPILASMSPPSFHLSEIATAPPPESTSTSYDMQADLLGNLWVFAEDGHLFELSAASGAIQFEVQTGFLTRYEAWAVMTYQNAVYLFGNADFAEVNPTTHLPGPARPVVGLPAGDFVIGASAVPCIGFAAPP